MSIKTLYFDYTISLYQSDYDGVESILQSLNVLCVCGHVYVTKLY